MSSYGIPLCLSYIMYLSLTNSCTVRFTSFCNSWHEMFAIYWNHVSCIKHFPSTSNKSAIVDVLTLLQLYQAVSVLSIYCRYSLFFFLLELLFDYLDVLRAQQLVCSNVTLLQKKWKIPRFLFMYSHQILNLHQIQYLLCLICIKRNPFQPFMTECSNRGRTYF